MADDPWVAFFCPNCGCTLNEVDLDTDDPDQTRRRNMGQVVTCGWCKQTTRDWGHIKRCKATYELRMRQEAERREQATVDIYRELLETE